MNGDDDRDFESRWYSLDVGVQIVADWFTIEGSSMDETEVGTAVYVVQTLRNIEYFIGPCTALDDTERLADVAAQVGLGLPFDADTLRAMVGPVLSRHHIDGTTLAVEFPTGDDEDEALWLVARPAVELLESEALDTFLSGFINIAEEMVEALG